MRKKPQAPQLEVMIVGKGFTPGEQANEWIAHRLGVEGDAPDYCNTEGLALNLLRERAESVYSAPTMSGMHVVTFNVDGVVYATVESDTPERACAIALCYLLLDSN